MHLIKLDAIGSTNDFLKDLAKAENLQNFTVVYAENQTSGRGQRGTQWNSEPGKNLTMSVFVRLPVRNTAELFVLNSAVALSVLRALEKFSIPELSLKWPNDILSGKKKIAGILIENNVKSASLVESVIGIGLNANQETFEGLPNAGSLFTQTGRVFDKLELLKEIVDCLKTSVSRFESDPEKIWEDYNANLFRKGKPAVFKDESGKAFMGIIVGASTDGTIRIMLEDDSVKSFGIKEISMQY